MIWLLRDGRECSGGDEEEGDGMGVSDLGGMVGRGVIGVEEMCVEYGGGK